METEAEKQTGRIGRWMMVLTWVFLFILLSMLFSGILDRQNNPNRHLSSQVDQQGPAEVTLKRNRMGHYVAPGEINGYPVVFLLDTGATDVALSQALAERLNLPKGASFNSMTANGVVRSTRTRLDRVQLGPILISDVTASVLPSMPNNEVLLGMSFLKQLELVQRGDTLKLKAY